MSDVLRVYFAVLGSHVCHSASSDTYIWPTTVFMMQVGEAYVKTYNKCVDIWLEIKQDA